ncbi:MAG TPA: hypothetical protein ENF47_06890 [Thermoprotei archaeon]|nr:hypothetical protein [Thermoprotei archaeon]
MRRVKYIGVKLPIIEPGVDLPKIILDSIHESGEVLREGDILVITLKIVSKYLGLLKDISRIEPSREALRLSKKTGLDARYLELLIRESDEIVFAIPFSKLVNIDHFARNFGYSYKDAVNAIKKYPTLFITLRDGHIWSDSGIDSSNHPSNIYSIPPRDIDEVAKSISEKISNLVGFKIPVILCDTELFPWGTMDIPRGTYGIRILTREFGKPDLYGKPKFGGVDNIAYSICGSCSLIFRQSDEGIPVVIVRGVDYEWVDEGMNAQAPVEYDKYDEYIAKIIKYNVRILGLRRVFKPFVKAILKLIR